MSQSSRRSLDSRCYEMMLPLPLVAAETVAVERGHGELRGDFEPSSVSVARDDTHMRRVAMVHVRHTSHNVILIPLACKTCLYWCQFGGN